MTKETLPPGNYGFMEFYCDEDDCDCRRVILQVHREDIPEKVWATINYGWESAEYYRNWLGGGELARGLASVCLEPFGSQSEFAEELLDYFVKYLLTNEAYVSRLKRHYTELKGLIRDTSYQSAPPGNRAMRRSRKKGQGKREF
jgi:hypothetical protein